MSAKRNDKFTIFLTIQGIKNVPKFGKSACVCVCVCVSVVLEKGRIAVLQVCERVSIL